MDSVTKGFRFSPYLLLILSFFFFSTSFAAHQTVNLVISYKTVHFAGKNRIAIAVNNQIPAPTLHFKEGDNVTINVYNHLDKETAIHWHGILLPWQMDGVLGINQQGIPPHGVFHYQFTLKQSGTYWYHAHAGLQEQQGLYGAFLIDPVKHPPYHYNKDYVIVLSDWSNTDPDQILSNLKKDGDYYSPRFPLQPSLMKFIHDYRKASAVERAQLLDDYKMMQKMRMSIYDLSDVAYDGFLLNGQPKKYPWNAPVSLGDVVRLRFIGAGGSTIFHVKIPGSSMKMVHVQGNDVKPYFINQFAIAPGETYDVLVHIQKDHPYIIYAESNDTVGAAYGALITHQHQSVNYQAVNPFPEPLPVTRDMMSMMMGKMNHSMNMHEMHEMPTEPTIIGDALSPPHSSYSTSKGTKYENMGASVKTNNPNKPVTGVINMELFGYMDRFIWFINDVPEQYAHPIILKPGKRYRIVFTNTSMMHHPMHIHGHWFILRKGNGEYDPLLHTIDVPPGATITADVDTDASGQWIFHCHFLYHMMAGMARTIQYSTLIEITKNEAKPQNIIKQTSFHNRPIVRVDETRPIDVSLIKHPMAHHPMLWLANFFDAGINPVTNVQQFTFKGLYGHDYHKLQLFMNDAEINEGRVENADIDIFYWHLLNQFWAVKSGVNYFYRPTKSPYWQPGIGIEGLMPYFIDTNLRGYFYSGSAKLDIELSRDTQITNNFFIRLGARMILASKTVTQAAIGSGLNQMQYTLRPYYRFMPGMNIFIEFERDQYYGAFKTIQENLGNSSGENTLTMGLSIIF
jgi:FtsP/CotA-like multicopper oxidase with cupredoxin domain